MADTTLLLLAGYCGVGKSTLTLAALKRDLPLFGAAHQPAFRRTALPPRLPEWAVPAHELVAAGSWFNDKHLRQLSPGQLPRTFVLHVDLVSFFTQPYVEDTAPVADIMPRTLGNLQDAEANRRFARMQLSCPLLKGHKRVAVTTLYAPWEENARRWFHRHERTGLTPDAGRAWLFDARFGPAIHREIHARWIEALQWLEPKPALHAVSRGGQWEFSSRPPALD